MFYGIVLALFCALLTSCAGKPPSEDSVEVSQLHLRIGIGYLQGGNYPAALREFLKAEKINPNSPRILNNLALAYFVREETDVAVEKLNKAINLEPTFSEARNNLARIHIENGNYREALQQLEIVNEDLLYPQPAKSWTNTGLAYFHLKEYEAARAALRKALSLSRNYCSAHVLFGRTFFEQKNYQAASEYLDQAVALCRQEKKDEPNYYSALSYLKLGDSARAKARMDEVIVLSPTGKFAEKARSILQLMN